MLVGAQAIYMHTGLADLAVAEYTTDADFGVSPDDLADSPLLGISSRQAASRRASTLVGG